MHSLVFDYNIQKESTASTLCSASVVACKTKVVVAAEHRDRACRLMSWRARLKRIDEIKAVSSFPVGFKWDSPTSRVHTLRYVPAQ